LVIQNNKWLLKSNLYSIVLSLKIIGRENGFKKKELGMIQMRIYKQNHYVQSKKKSLVIVSFMQLMFLLVVQLMKVLLVQHNNIKIETVIV